MKLFSAHPTLGRGCWNTDQQPLVVSHSIHHRAERNGNIDPYLSGLQIDRESLHSFSPYLFHTTADYLVSSQQHRRNKSSQSSFVSDKIHSQWPCFHLSTCVHLKRWFSCSLHLQLQHPKCALIADRSSFLFTRVKRNNQSSDYEDWFAIKQSFSKWTKIRKTCAGTQQKK